MEQVICIAPKFSTDFTKSILRQPFFELFNLKQLAFLLSFQIFQLFNCVFEDAHPILPLDC